MNWNSDFKLELSFINLFLISRENWQKYLKIKKLISDSELSRGVSNSRRAYSARLSSAPWRRKSSTAICAPSLHYHSNRGHELKETTVCPRSSSEEFNNSPWESFTSVRWRRQWFYHSRRKVLFSACKFPLWRTLARRGRKKASLNSEASTGEKNNKHVGTTKIHFKKKERKKKVVSVRRKAL